jgi:hypothetical protein
MEWRVTHSVVVATRPDIIIKKKASILIAAAIPADRNVMQQKAEKKLKCV